MRPRVRLFTFVLAISLPVVVATPVAGWANGGDDGNGYGTHDWILDQGLQILNAQGYDVSWFDRTAALLKTDDPDTVFKIKSDHVYRAAHHSGGAVHQIAAYYSLAMDAYQAGHLKEASEDVGLLAHFLGDISEPFHTSATDHPTAHHEYESAVQAKIGKSPTAMPAWRDSSQPVSLTANIRTLAVANAAYSRARFDDLYDAWRVTSSVSDPTVFRITGEVLKRAGRDMARVIWSITNGLGRQPDLGTLKATLKWVGVDRNEDYEPIYITALDVNGRPIEGLQVDLAWPACATTLRPAPVKTWTDATGQQKITPGLEACPLLVRKYVTVTATVNGVTKTVRPWFLPSPLLPYGGAGFRTTISDATPAVGQTVTVTSRARNSKGNGVPGLRVWWTWDFNGVLVKTSGLTDSTGRATSSYLVTSSTYAGRVDVTAHTQSHSRNRSSSTSFNRT